MYLYTDSAKKKIHIGFYLSAARNVLPQKQAEKLNGSKRSQHLDSLELVHISMNFSSYQT